MSEETFGMGFDPMVDVMFRGKPLPALDQRELLEALCAALKRVRYLETISPERHRSWGPAAGFGSPDGQHLKP